MRKRREPKESDREDVMRVIDLVYEVLKDNKHLDGSLWISAFQSIAAQSMHNTGFTYEEYCHEMDRIKKGYKQLWETHEVDEIT